MIQKAKDEYEWTFTAANGVLEAKQNDEQARCQIILDKVEAESVVYRELKSRMDALASRVLRLGLKVLDFPPKAPRQPATVSETVGLARARRELAKTWKALPAMHRLFVINLEVNRGRE